MPAPTLQHMTLVGGVNSTYSTIFTSSLIKVGDNLKLTGTTANDGIFTVSDIVTTLNTAEAEGTTWTDATRAGAILSGTTIIMDGAQDKLVAGLSVSGTNIQSSTYISSVTSTSDPATFVISKSVGGTVSGGTTLTFGDIDVYYVLKGKPVTTDSSGGDPEIQIIRAPGDKMIALGDVDSAGGVDVWSTNATTDYSTKDNGWTASAITPTIDGDDAKYIYHFADEALRVCNINETNTTSVKWYGYIQRNQFNLSTGPVFAEWQEHPNHLAPPRVATGKISYAYGHVNHAADTGSDGRNYYKNNRGVAVHKKDSTGDLQLGFEPTSVSTGFKFENGAGAGRTGRAIAGEVITIKEASGGVGDLGDYPKEFLFCKQGFKPSSGTATYSRAYGGALPLGLAPYNYAADDTPIIERGLGFNIGIDDGSGNGTWESGTYEFWQTFIYDGNQESLPVKVGDGAATTSLVAFTHEAAGNKPLRVSVYADLAYNGRITGGRVYTRLNGTDDDLILLADIDIVKGMRTNLDGDHIKWVYETGKGYHVLSGTYGNSINPNIDTYIGINTFSPDVKFLGIGGTNEIYKASVVANRRTFVANVKIKGRSGELEKFGDRIMYSEMGKFDTFLEHNFIDVAKGDYGEYTALEFYADRLLAFKHNLVHIINIASVSVSNWYPEETIKHFGANFPFSVAKTKYGVAWVSDDGCYLYDGKTVRNLIDKKLAVSKASFTDTEINWNSFYRGSAIVKDIMLGYDPISNSLIMMRSPNDDSDNSHKSFVYDFDSNGWTYHTGIFTNHLYYTNFITDWNNNLSLGVFDGSTDVEFKKFLPISVAQSGQEFNTRDIDFGSPSLIKKVYAVTMTYKSSAEQQTPLYYAIDGTQSFSSFTSDITPQGNTGGAGYLESTASSGADWDIATFTVSPPISCQSIQFQLDLPTSGTFEVNDITIEYRIIRNKNVS